MAVERVKIGFGHKKTSGNGAKRAVENGFERDFVGFGNGIGVGYFGLLFGGFEGLSLGGFEFAIDNYEDILIEAGIGFDARFRLGSAYEDVVIVLEKTRAPFEGSERMVVLECVCAALRLFDEVAVGDAPFGPVCREMVGIDLEEAASKGSAASNDVFLVSTTFLKGVDFTDIRFEHGNRLKIAHTPCWRR